MFNRGLCLLLRILLPIIAALGSKVKVRAQALFQHYTPRNTSLESEMIYVLEQDQWGNVWMATPSGLWLFDGLSFRQYDSEVHEDVINLAKTTDGKLWSMAFNGNIRFVDISNPGAVFLHRLSFPLSPLPDSLPALYAYEDRTGLLHFLKGRDKALVLKPGMTSLLKNAGHEKNYFLKHLLRAHTLENGLLDPLRTQDAALNIDSSWHSYDGRLFLMRVLHNRFLVVENKIYFLSSGKSRLMIDGADYGIHDLITGFTRAGDDLYLTLLSGSAGARRINNFYSTTLPRSIDTLVNCSFAGSVVADAFGNIWISSLSETLFRIPRHFVPIRSIQLPEQVNVTDQYLSSRGHTLLGTQQGDVYLVRTGSRQPVKVYTCRKRKPQTCLFVPADRPEHVYFINADGIFSYALGETPVRECVSIANYPYHLLESATLRGNHIIGYDKRRVIYQNLAQKKTWWEILPLQINDGFPLDDQEHLLATSAGLVRYSSRSREITSVSNALQGKNIQWVKNWQGNWLAGNNGLAFLIRPGGKLIAACDLRKQYGIKTVDRVRGNGRDVYLLTDKGILGFDTPQFRPSFYLPISQVNPYYTDFFTSTDTMVVTTGSNHFKGSLRQLNHIDDAFGVIIGNTQYNGNNLTGTKEARYNNAGILTVLLQWQNAEHPYFQKDFSLSLEGEPDRWIPAGGSKLLIPVYRPGTYLLKARLTQLLTGKQHQAMQTIIIRPLFYQTSGFFLLCISLLVTMSGVFILAGARRLSRKKMTRILTEQKMRELEASSMLNQLNPHFIFNALTPLQNSILRNEPREALRYLNQISTLMRSMLQQGQRTEQTLTEEVRFLGEYLNIQQKRRNGRFQYSVHASSDLPPDVVLMPTLLVQPLVENAVEHGLSDSSVMEGSIGVSFEKAGDRLLMITVTDNGVGLADDFKMKGDHATGIISKRLELLGQQSGMPASLHISKRPEGGTIAVLLVPIRYQ